MQSTNSAAGIDFAGVAWGYGSAPPTTIAAAGCLDLWYNETAVKMPGAAATA